MNDLNHFFYLSSACELMAPEALAGILAVSRRNNERDGLTGMLIYQDGVFVQYIEGALQPIEAAKARILEDPRHKGVIRMTERLAPVRYFPNWSMGFQDAGLLGAPFGGFDLSFAALEARMREGLPAHLQSMMRQVYMNAA